MIKQPLVSCLMLTYNRFSLFKQAVQNFADQDYPYKELIIVNNGNWLYKMRVDNFIQSQNLNIKHLKIEKKSIGEMRNIGISACSGGYIMIFDDDDIHASNRISYQLDICLKSNVDGTLLKNFMASLSKERYLCSFKTGLEGTLLFKHPGELIKYNEINQGEDTFFIKNLKENKYNLIVLFNDHNMYEYRFHGKNTVSEKHFRKIINKIDTVSVKQIQTGD